MIHCKKEVNGMPNNLLEALKTDLEQNYMPVKTRENWQAICSNVIMTIIQAGKFYSAGFNNVVAYVNGKPKEMIMEEIKSYVYRAENILDYGTLSNKAATAIVNDIFDLENDMQQDIVSDICKKIDTINANPDFKEYVKKQIREGTISDDELRRYGIITEKEINDYHAYLNSIGSSGMTNYSK